MKRLLFLFLFPVILYSQVDISPSFINFDKVPVGSVKDTTFTITSQVESLTLNSFDFIFGSDAYSIKESFPLVLTKGTPLTLNLNFRPKNSVKSYTQYQITTDDSTYKLNLLGGYDYQDTIAGATKITTPVKNDYYLYKDEIVINWTKVLNYDRYIIRFSANNGRNWTNITDSAVGTSYRWKAAHINSNECSFRVEPYFNPEKNKFEVEWDNYIGVSRSDLSNKLIQTSDGGYIIVGKTISKDSSSDNKLHYKMLIIKTDIDGNQIWTKTYGSKEGEDVANSVIETKEKDLLIIGTTSSPDLGFDLKGSYDVLLTKLTKNGDLIWMKNFGGSKDDLGIDLEEDINGDYYLGGYTSSNDGDISNNHGLSDYLLMKIDIEGNLLWEKTYGFRLHENLKDLQKSIDGGFILYGSSNSRDSVYMGDKYGSFEDKDHGWILKVDAEGNEEWEYQYIHGRDEIYLITESPKGDIYASGYTVFYHSFNNLKRNLWLLKLNKFGEKIWQNQYTNFSDDVPLGIKITNKDEIFLYTSYFTNDGFLKRIIKLYNSGSTSYYKNISYLMNYGTNGFSSTFDNGMALLGTRTDILKSNPLNFSLVKISNEHNFDIGYSGIFEIASSKPQFTNDTIEFPVTYKGEIRDTIIKDFVCNLGSVPIEITEYLFPNSHPEFTLDSVYGDNTLDVDECLDLKFSFSTKLLNQRQTRFYLNYDNGTSNNFVTLRAFVVDKKLGNKLDSIRFGKVYIGEKSDIKYLDLRNYSQFPIKINLVQNFSSANDIIVNNGVNEFYIDGDSNYKVPIEYIANVVKKDTMTLRIFYDDSVTINTVYIQGEAINNSNTKVTESMENYSELSINPNPATDGLNVTITTGTQGTMNLELVSTDGRVIYSENWQQSTRTKQMRINTIGIPSGLYQVRLITPYDAITKSVVVVE